MKVLRVLRRRKIKLSFIFVLLLFFIFNTYAWIRTDRNTEMGSLALNVDDWSVAFIIDGEEIETEEYIFEVPEFYPGITTGTPIEKKIDVYNTGDSDSTLKYEITEIYLYGEQIYKNEVVENDETKYVPETLGEETGEEYEPKTANIFGNSNATIFQEGNTNYTFSLKYPTPFTITYSYDKDYIEGKDGVETSKAWMKINLSWENNEENNEEDTRLGNMVYEFENAKDANGNLVNGGEPALRITTRVTANKVNNSGDVDYSN